MIALQNTRLATTRTSTATERPEASDGIQDGDP